MITVYTYVGEYPFHFRLEFQFCQNIDIYTGIFARDLDVFI